MSETYRTNSQSPRWTKQEVELLKELYAKATKEEIITVLNRTWNAIRLKAERSGFCRWSTKIDKSRKDKQRLASRRYYQRNRDKMLEAHKRYHKRNKERLNEKQRIYHAKCRKKIFEIFGTKCILCGVDKKEGAKIEFHEKHGNEHRYYYNYILKHPEDFVPLCTTCHRMVTKIMKFNVTWETILDFLSPNRGENVSLADATLKETV